MNWLLLVDPYLIYNIADFIDRAEKFYYLWLLFNILLTLF